MTVRHCDYGGRPPNPRCSGRHPGGLTNVLAPGVEQLRLRSATQPGGTAEALPVKRLLGGEWRRQGLRGFRREQACLLEYQC